MLAPRNLPCWEEFRIWVRALGKNFGDHVLAEMWGGGGGGGDVHALMVCSRGP